MKILCIKSRGLGDIVHTFPALNQLRNTFPDAQIDWIIEKRYKDIMLMNKNVDKVYPLSMEKISSEENRKLILNLLSKKYDILINFDGQPFFHLLSLIINAKLKLGRISQNEKIMRNFSKLIYHYPYFEKRIPRHIIYDHLELINQKIDYKKSINYLFYLKKEYKSKLKNNKKIIGIHIGSGTIGKRWPVGYWIKLISLFPNKEFYIFHGHKETDIIKIIPNQKNIYIISRLDLKSEISKLQECSLFISGDTGFLHLAESLGIKVLALMGQTNPKRYGPFFKYNHYICKTNSFNLDSQDNNPSMKSIHPSMYKITPEEVERNIEEMLNE